MGRFTIAMSRGPNDRGLTGLALATEARLRKEGMNTAVLAMFLGTPAQVVIGSIREG
jgi:hypothetical protein